jgi:hypothetical protein
MYGRISDKRSAISLHKKTPIKNQRNIEKIMKTQKQLQLVTFEQAKRLKAAGFDWDVYNSYYCLDEENYNLEGYAYEMDINRKLPNNPNLEKKNHGLLFCPHRSHCA